MSFTTATSVSLQGSANLTLQDGDWCLAAMVYLPSSAGPQWNTILSAGLALSTDELAFGIHEDGRPSSQGPGSLAVRIVDTGDRLLTAWGGATKFPLNKWCLAVLQRSGSEKVQLWQTPFNGTPVKLAGVVATFGACPFSTPMTLLNRRLSLGIDHAFIGTTAYIFRLATAALTEAQMTALANGATPPSILTMDEYIPMMEAGSASVKAIIGGQTYTATGSPSTGSQPMRLF